MRRVAGDRWQENDLAFASAVGTELDAHNVRRAFRKVVKKADLVETKWTPRKLRHSFVSLLSDSGMPIEQISRLTGTTGRPSPNWSTATSSGPSSSTERK